MKETQSARWIPGFIALGIVWGSSFLFIKWGLETLTPVGVAFWLGVLIGLVGNLFVTGALSEGNQNNWRGIVALLLATLCYGIAFPYSKRFVGSMDYSPTSLAAAQVCLSALLLSPLALTSGTSHGKWATKTS